MRAIRRRWRRCRFWLGRKIMPANVLTLDVGPFMDGLREASRALEKLRPVRLEYDTTPLLDDEETRP